MIYEVSNALKFNPSFSSEDVKKAVDSLMKMDMNIITPQKTTIERSIEIASSQDTSVYDVFYVALAEDLRSELVTSDERLYEKTKNLETVRLLNEF